MHQSHSSKDNTPQLRLVFWETTSACNLKCLHCRAVAGEFRPPGELSLEQSYALLDDIACFSKPVIVLSGGEPLIRDDIFEIASYGDKLGLRMVLATNGTTVTPENASKMKQSGIQRISISIDGADAQTHDSFRQIQGAFEAALHGVKLAQAAGIPVQINTTIARHNLDQLEQIYTLALSIDACALHFFLLVPTGCGKELADTEMIAPEDYERVLEWIYLTSKKSPINLKATCAPHYFRVMRQKAKAEGTTISHHAHGMDAVTKGCLAGSSVCFVSHMGEVFPCGYFPVSAGNVLNTSFKEIWEGSTLFGQLRDATLLKGKCGVCEYSRVCGGCRARAYAETGDFLGEEPYCNFTPSAIAGL